MLQIVAVHTGMPVRRPAVMFGVPKSTLQDKISGKVPVSMRKGSTPYSANGAGGSN